MWKIWKGKDQDGQPQATRANLGETQSSMYYDQEKKRWRERGKEHLEEEDPGLKPPPKVDEITKPGGDAPPQAPQPAKPASAADELCAPPPPSYLSNLRKPKATQPPARPQVALGAFGMPPASGEAGNEAHEDNADQGGVKLQANPNAPRAFTGQGMNMKVNPNAPRAFRRDGAAAPKENRQRKGPQAGGRPRQSPYSSAFPAFVPPSGGGDPEGGGGEDGMPESNSTPPLPSPCPPTVPGFPPPSMAVDAEGGSNEAAPDADVHPPHLSPHAPDVPAFISPSAVVDAEGGCADEKNPDAEGSNFGLPSAGVAPLSTMSLASTPLEEVGEEGAALQQAEDFASRVPKMRVRANPFASAQKSPCNAEHKSLLPVGAQPEANKTSPASETSFMRESSCALDQESPADATQIALGARQEANEASPMVPEMRVRANPCASSPQSCSGVTEASLLGAQPELLPAGYRGDPSEEDEQEQKVDALAEEGELVEEEEDGEIAEDGEVAEEGELAGEGQVAEDLAAGATVATAEEVECSSGTGEVTEKVSTDVEKVATVVAAEEDGEVVEEGTHREQKRVRRKPFPSRVSEGSVDASVQEIGSTIAIPEEEEEVGSIFADTKANTVTVAKEEVMEDRPAAAGQEVPAEVESVAEFGAAEEDDEIVEDGEFEGATAAARVVAGGAQVSTMTEEEKGAAKGNVKNEELHLVEGVVCFAGAPSPQPESEQSTPASSRRPERENPEVAEHGVMVEEATDVPLRVASASAPVVVEEVPQEDQAHAISSRGDMGIDVVDHQESAASAPPAEATRALTVPSEILAPLAVSASGVRVKHTFTDSPCEEEMEATMGVQSAPASAWPKEQTLESSWNIDNGFGDEEAAAEIAIEGGHSVAGHSTGNASRAAAVDRREVPMVDCTTAGTVAAEALAGELSQEPSLSGNGESLSSWHVLSEEQRIAAAANDALRIEVAELREANATLERALAESRDLAESQQGKVDELSLRCPELERLIQAAQASAETHEEALSVERRRAEDAEHQLEEALRRASDAEQRLDDALAVTTTPHNLPEGEEFSLPNFMWSCENSEILEFVKKLGADNASLRREADNVRDGRFRMPGTSSPFDPTDVNIDRALTFVQTISEGDGHQIPPLLALLQEHASNAELCSRVCTALESLTFTNAEHRRAIMRHGGVEAVLCVMEQHGDADPSRIRPAMDALWNLTFDDEVVARVSEAGGIERVLAVMRKHDGIAELQGAACAVLLNLASTEGRSREIVQTGAPLVAAAMHRHSTNEDVLEQGCQTLYMLAQGEHLRSPALVAAAIEAAKLATTSPCGLGRAQKWGRLLQEVLLC